MKLVVTIQRLGGPVIEWVGENQETYTIGRGNVDIPLDEPKCSRSHAIFYIDPAGQLCVLDLDSTNGTYLESTNIDSARLNVGSSLLVGDTRLTVVSFEPHNESTSPYYIEDNGTKSVTLFGWPSALGGLSKKKLDNFLEFFESTNKKVDKRK
ncbi:FHA domain-containing protein [bacterium]|nr:FHA domain-containing protein [bacterium]